VAVLVTERFCTLRELTGEGGYYYTLEEALDMFEVAMTNRYNEWKAMKDAERKAGARG
jgi:hypothetical protein